ncbi:Hint domain-containing protein [Sinirhodobacter sp. HNIBRBA609]|nr:Hint domain-containing protein [Sinirhodobacter sp. HNIBRBA609]
MADSTYTGPIYLTGDMVAQLSSKPTSPPGVNPGQTGYGIVMPGVDALGAESDLYRLVWWQNPNTTATSFISGQTWKLQSYDPAADTDIDPYNGDAGWKTIPVYSSLTPRNDLVSGLGAGDDYVVLQSGSHYLLYDLNGGLPQSPTTLTYYATDENGDLTVGDNDGQLDFSDAYASGPNVICFAAGTRIDTIFGELPVEDLRPGILVRTLDHDFQPILWIGRSEVSPNRLQEAPNLRPIRIRAGAVGRGKPNADLMVSPQHRILVRSQIAARVCGEPEVLLGAKHLTSLPGIDQITPKDGVIYFHLLFDRHEIIFANGLEAESLLTGPQAWRSLSPGARQEILTLFPELREASHGLPARTLAPGRKAASIARRHLLNRKPLLS